MLIHVRAFVPENRSMFLYCTECGAPRLQERRPFYDDALRGRAYECRHHVPEMMQGRQFINYWRVDDEEDDDGRT